MQKCFNLNPKDLLQIPKTFLGIELLRIETSLFIGSSARVDLGFHTTAGYFPLKVWEKIWIWKVRKKVISFESFIRTRTSQGGEPTGDFLAELLNVFSSQFEQMCKIVSNPEKNIFSYNLASGQLKCSYESLDFFRWMSKIFFLKILK